MEHLDLKDLHHFRVIPDLIGNGEKLLFLGFFVLTDFHHLLATHQIYNVTFFPYYHLK